MPVPAAPAPVVTSTDYDEIVVDLGASNASYQRNVAIRTGDQTTTDPSRWRHCGDHSRHPDDVHVHRSLATPPEPDTQYTLSQRFIV